MNRDQVISLLARKRVELERLGVKTLAVFGSTARNDASDASDVDILVEFKGPATFDGYMDLKEFLEDLLGRPVDLVTRRALKPAMKSDIEAEAVYVT